MKLLLIAAGGGIGSVLRYLISGWAQNLNSDSVFPIGTLSVNAVGCLIIGLLSQLVEDRGFLGPEARSLLLVGLLGGFTTFSTFANESFNALRDGAVALALLNIGAQIVLGLAAVWGGRVAAHLIWS